MKENVLKHERNYPFDSVDIDFIADLTFSVRFGMDAGGFGLSRGVAENQGFDFCVSALEKIDKDLSK